MTHLLQVVTPGIGEGHRADLSQFHLDDGCGVILVDHPGDVLVPGRGRPGDVLEVLELLNPLLDPGANGCRGDVGAIRHRDDDIGAQRGGLREGHLELVVGQLGGGTRDGEGIVVVAVQGDHS